LSFLLVTLSVIIDYRITIISALASRDVNEYIICIALYQTVSKQCIYKLSLFTASWINIYTCK